MRTVVLLRGVNVGGSARLPMVELRRLLADLGGQDVATYLQSGNAVARIDPDGLAERVAAGLRDRLGLDVVVMVRGADELLRVVRDNPFPHRVDEPKLLHVAFCDRQPDPGAVDAVGLRHGDDEVAVGERCLYLSYATGSQRSPLEAPLRRLRLVTTARNWTTVTRLADLGQGP